MSNRLRLRAPAWSGFTPAPETFRPAGGAVSAELGEALGMDGRVFARPSSHSQIEGFYHFFPESEYPALFLKVITGERLAQQWAADRIATWLYDQGVVTSRLLPDFPRPLAAGRQLLGYELVDGEPADRDASILPRLGRAMAQMHRALRDLPWRDEIRRASAKRDREFRRARQGLLKRSRLDPGLRSILLADSTELPGDPAQPLHADLNLGNVLFGSVDRDPVLLDFEDALHNHHHIGVDLAMAIERFALVRQADDAQALAASAQLLSGYREISDPVWPDTGLAGVLRALSVRALVLLHQGPGPVDRAERDKFVRLIRQCADRRDLLERIQAL